MFFISLYLLISFFVFHKSRFSRLASGLPHALFQLNGYYFHALNYVVQGIRSKSEQNQKQRDQHVKPDKHSALGYQNSLKLLLAGISIMLNSLQFRN